MGSTQLRISVQFSDSSQRHPIVAGAFCAYSEEPERAEKSRALRTYQRRTKRADALIAGCYLAGTNTLRVRRALSTVFGGAPGKDTMSRVWRRVKGIRMLGAPARSPRATPSA